ncbi:hypothetical protein [Clostridium brassicae]|uniref:Uncharacterized protein n=1 Tax=Clostridium brassicae TaxID=2999072 RepID=A0ABT4D7J5_9CLOT|nr:hypothetical protein [Clostridium brassicae]MCY6958133.1 hypothetical protein [Clostridium brassicae]
MFSLLRGGPKILLIQPSNMEEFLKYLETETNFKESDFKFAYEHCGESYTMLCLSYDMKETVIQEDISHVFLAKVQPDTLLCNMINEDKIQLITSSRLAPEIIVMRGVGNLEKVLNAIHKDYGGLIGKFESILSQNNNKGNVIILSQGRLSNNVSLTNTYEKVLYIQEEYYSLFESLRIHALRYANEGLENRDWYELEVKIYDRYGDYELQYERLIRVIDGLELGMILGESWGKDYPRFLMSVEVYRLRFFTVYEPKYIKKILLAMEYSEDGRRLVDYDLYYNRKKIDWTDVIEKKFNGRNDLGYKYRKDILRNLSSKEIDKLKNLEYEILNHQK